jgi:hypothetical protein
MKSNINKTSIFTLALLLLAGCETKNDTTINNSTGQTGTSKTEFITNKAANCKIKFLKNDTLEIIAIKANQARVECKLAEEEVITLINEIKN